MAKDILDNKEDFGKLLELVREYSPESVGEAIGYALLKVDALDMANKVIRVAAGVDAVR